MATAERNVNGSETVRAEWVNDLETLLGLVKGWAEGAGWGVRRDTKTATEPALGRYAAPLLRLERGEVEFILNPLAAPDLESPGVVDLYLMPGYDDVVSLHFEGGQWSIHPCPHSEPTAPRLAFDSGRLPLDEPTFHRVLDATAARA